MQFFLIAALGCFIVSLICALGGGPVLDTGWPSWVDGGLIAVVLEWLVGGNFQINKA